MLNIAGLVERLNAIGEEEMYQAPATTKRTINEAADTLSQLMQERSWREEGAKILAEVVRIDSEYDIEMYIDEFDDSIADHHIWRELMESARPLALPDPPQVSKDG